MNIKRALPLMTLLIVAALYVCIGSDGDKAGVEMAHAAVESPVLAEPDKASIRREIVEANRKMVETMKRGDLLGVSRFYADDAMILFHRGQKIQGRKAIDAYWTSIKGAKDWKLDVIEVGGSRDEVYQIGKSSFTSEADGKENTYTCDFIVIWKRQTDGAYKIQVDIYN
ncbi:MAG: nuclear transport factor 2 family protein [Pyrinomonadaceae bacterium]|jgi:ketosteroid isomerase-like protein